MSTRLTNLEEDEPVECARRSPTECSCQLIVHGMGPVQADRQRRGCRHDHDRRGAAPTTALACDTCRAGDLRHP